MEPLKRFVIHYEVDRNQPLTNLKKNLKQNGIDEKDIDVIKNSLKSKGFKIVKSSLAAEVALLSSLIGGVVGLVAWLFGFNPFFIISGSWNSGATWNAGLSQSLVGAGIGSIVGGVVGLKSFRHIVLYGSKNARDTRSILAVNCDWDQREKVMTILNRYPGQVVTTDKKFENEIGM